MEGDSPGPELPGQFRAPRGFEGSMGGSSKQGLRVPEEGLLRTSLPTRPLTPRPRQ